MYKCSALCDRSMLRTGMAGQRFARTVITVYSSAIQQVVGYRLLSFCIQECSRSSAVKEGGARRQSVEKL